MFFPLFFFILFDLFLGELESLYTPPCPYMYAHAAISGFF